MMASETKTNFHRSTRFDDYANETGAIEMRKTEVIMKTGSQKMFHLIIVLRLCSFRF